MNPKKEKIKLSISLLVSNSIDTIEKCMNSLVPLLEQVPSELIVVDTGGCDGSIEIARKYADKVVPFTWCNDFAKARNAGLMVAKGEWFLFLDDDEWFEDVSEIIDFFNSGEYLKYNCATYIIRNYTSFKSNSWGEIRSHRIAKRTGELRFVSPIHEMLYPINMPEKMFNCYVHHYGYVFANKKDERKHAMRNINLLKDALEKNPEEFRLLLQLAQGYRAIDEMEMSKEICLNAIALSKKLNKYNFYNVKMLGWILQNVILMEIEMQNEEKAFEYGKEYIEYSWINRVTKMNLANELLKLSIKLNKYEECFGYLEIYERIYLYLRENVQKQREETILEQDLCFREERYVENLIQAFHKAFEINNEEKTTLYIGKILSLPAFDRSRNEVKDFLSYLLQEKDKRQQKTVVSYLIQREQIRKQLVILINEEELWTREEYEKLIEIFGEKRLEEKEFLPYHIIYQYNHGRDVRELLTEYFSAKANILYRIYPIFEITEALKVDMAPFIHKKEVSEWMESANNFAARGSEKEHRIMIRILSNSEEKSFKIDFLRMRCLERILRSKTVVEYSYQELHELVKEYSEEVLSVYKNIYNEEAFYNEYTVFVPKSCRFAGKVKSIVESNLDEVTAAKIMKEAAEVYPEMANFCKEYILKMQEEHKKANVPEEFLQLSVMIKGKIREFIAMGAMDAAKQTLMQLEAMIPGDAEVTELKKEIEE